EREKGREAGRWGDGRKTPAGWVVRESDRALAQAASDGRTSLSVHWDEHGLRRTAGVPLLWSPATGQQQEAPSHHFATGEHLEFAGKQPEPAIAAYRDLLRNPDGAVRAGALLRIARCQRTLGRPRDALETYQRLGAMGAVRVAGAPGELVSHRERAALFDEAKDFAAASREKEKLKAVLDTRAGSLDRPTFEFYAQGIRI